MFTRIGRYLSKLVEEKSILVYKNEALIYKKVKNM